MYKDITQKERTVQNLKLNLNINSTFNSNAKLA